MRYCFVVTSGFRTFLFPQKVFLFPRLRYFHSKSGARVRSVLKFKILLQSLCEEMEKMLRGASKKTSTLHWLSIIEINML